MTGPGRRAEYLSSFFSRTRAANCVSTASYDVLVAGYYGFGNLGDELLAQSVIALLLSFGVDRKRIAILSNNPAESEEKFGVTAVDRWRLSAIREALLVSRTLLLGGGGLFQDATSARSCVYYWALIRLARMYRCRVWAFGQSVGPLSSPTSKWLAKTSFAACEYIGVRDEESGGILSGFGLACDLSPDLVFTLDLPLPREGGTSALLNVRPAGDGAWGDRIARAALELSAEGFLLRGVAFAREDGLELEKLAAVHGLAIEEILTPRSAEDFTEISKDAALALGMRLHFGILSLRRGLPLLMAPYDPKVSGFARQWGVSLLPGGEKKGDSVIIPLLRELALSAMDVPASARDARERVRASFFRAAALLLGDQLHG